MSICKKEKRTLNNQMTANKYEISKKNNFYSVFETVMEKFDIIIYIDFKKSYAGMRHVMKIAEK